MIEELRLTVGYGELNLSVKYILVGSMEFIIRIVDQY